MNGTVKEWLAKADGDYRTARRELGVKESPNYDAVCFHAQQCIEKTLKAMLIHKEVVPPRTHNLIRLSELVVSHYPDWVHGQEDFRFLTRAGVGFRYPDEFADREDAEEALTVCTRVRNGLLAVMPPEIAKKDDEGRPESGG